MDLFNREHLLRHTAASRNRFLHGIRCVPEDRLNWSPGGAASSPLGLADKLSGFLQFFNTYLRTQSMEGRGETPPPSASREEALARLDAAFDAVMQLIRDVDEELLEKTLIAPTRREVQVRAMLLYLPTITGYFQGQLNFLQLCYGDTDPNIPPDWGAEKI